jgi:hypothetical protein
MTYLEDEMSAHDGQPIELYEFYSNSTTYRFTSHVESVEFSGHTFNAIPITRGSLEGGTQEDSPTIEIRMPHKNRGYSRHIRRMRSRRRRLPRQVQQHYQLRRSPLYTIFQHFCSRVPIKCLFGSHSSFSRSLLLLRPCLRRSRSCRMLRRAASKIRASQ